VDCCIADGQVERRICPWRDILEQRREQIAEDAKAGTAVLRVCLEPGTWNLEQKV